MIPDVLAGMAERGRSTMVSSVVAACQAGEAQRAMLLSIIDTVHTRGRLSTNLERESLIYVLEGGIYAARVTGADTRFQFGPGDLDRVTVESLLTLTQTGLPKPIYFALNTGGGGLRSYGPFCLVLKESAADLLRDRIVCLVENSFNWIMHTRDRHPTLRMPLGDADVSRWIDRTLIAAYKRVRWMERDPVRLGLAASLHPSAPWVADHAVLSSGGACYDDYIECLVYAENLPMEDFAELRMFTEAIPIWLGDTELRELIARRAPHLRVSFVDSSRAAGARTLAPL